MTVNKKTPTSLIARAGRKSSGGASASPKNFKNAIPVYDSGGVAGVPDTDLLQLRRPDQETLASMDPNVQAPKASNRTRGAVADEGEDPSQVANTRQYPVQGLGAIPLFDDGGSVALDPVGDGDHELAVLENGERVLTPEENALYEQEHGAPVDFKGRVLEQPNPPVRPMEDT
jgi:hypothetical protein